MEDYDSQNYCDPGIDIGNKGGTRWSKIDEDFEKYDKANSGREDAERNQGID